MQLFLTSVLKNNYRNFVPKFILADVRGKIKLIQRGVSFIFLLILTIIFMPVFVAAIKLLEPVVKIRIGRLIYGRIGHLTSNTDLYLRRRASSPNSRQLHIFLSGKPVNRQMFTMIKRKLYIIENSMLDKIYENIRPHLNFLDIWVNLPYKGNEFADLNNVASQVQFTKEEERRGQELLESMGIGKDMPFVCFHARDKAYMNAAHPRNSSQFWAYHDYRDADINSYVPAAEYLTSAGLFAVRVGSIVECPIKTNNPKIIDYASYYRSDFMDVYLLGKCKFFLADTAGIQCISQIFDVPIAAVNWIPLKFSKVGRKDIFIPKKLWSIEESRFLTFREIIAAGIDSFIQTQDYTARGIEVISNTAQEITDLVKEMNARLDGSWPAAEDDEQLQQRYQSIFPEQHHSYGFPSRIGTEFLRQNQNLLA